ncbi:MAG: Eco47II family restriction endonuclease [Bacteroidaceae bacterium]|nr:Eco47II family restriction endonuclease [Bacteroidaceae bacterium]
MKQYNLGFVSDEEIYNHVKSTVLQYRRSINLKEFNKNIIDPIKLTFDSKIYGQTMAQTIESECIRQIDKTNNNRIGYFHQYLFKLAGNGWEVPANGDKGGFDVVNEERHIFVEMKNKPSKMKHSAKRALAIKAYDKLLHDKDATVMIVDMQNLSGINVPWIIRMDDMSFVNERLRIVSIDKFYDLIFSHDGAYSQICNALPTILSDIN